MRSRSRPRAAGYERISHSTIRRHSANVDGKASSHRESRMDSMRSGLARSACLRMAYAPTSTATTHRPGSIAWAMIPNRVSLPDTFR